MKRRSSRRKQGTTTRALTPSLMARRSSSLPGEQRALLAAAEAAAAAVPAVAVAAVVAAERNQKCWRASELAAAEVQSCLLCAEEVLGGFGSPGAVGLPCSCSKWAALEVNCFGSLHFFLHALLLSLSSASFSSSLFYFSISLVFFPHPPTFVKKVKLAKLKTPNQHTSRRCNAAVCATHGYLHRDGAFSRKNRELFTSQRKLLRSQIDPLLKFRSFTPHTVTQMLVSSCITDHSPSVHGPGGVARLRPSAKRARLLPPSASASIGTRACRAAAPPAGCLLASWLARLSAAASLCRLGAGGAHPPDSC